MLVHDSMQPDRDAVLRVHWNTQGIAFQPKQHLRRNTDDALSRKSQGGLGARLEDSWSWRSRRRLGETTRGKWPTLGLGSIGTSWRPYLLLIDGPRNSAASGDALFRKIENELKRSTGYRVWLGSHGELVKSSRHRSTVGSLDAPLGTVRVPHSVVNGVSTLLQQVGPVVHLGLGSNRTMGY